MKSEQHASMLTYRLIVLIRVHPYQPGHLDPVANIADIAPMMEGTLGEHMRMVVARPSSPMPIFADEHSVQQAMTNSCVNARDACGGSGIVLGHFGHEWMGPAGATAMLPEGE